MKEEKEEITTTQLDEIQKEIKENKEKALIKNIDRYKQYKWFFGRNFL